ncbi:MAG: DUF262 domain-containing protein [Kiritimatiellae bacterium]|nr:DUF262 domain-containing protein [Kiritimatiellia bacterium]
MIDDEKQLLVQIVDEESIDDDSSDSSVIDEPFNPTQIQVLHRSMLLDLLMRRIKSKAINLHPDFQRNEGVWSKVAKSRLIESLLIRIPIPAFYFDASDDDNWIVIDGLQRLSTVRDFVFGDMRLVGLEFLHNLEEKKYSELSVSLQRRIDETEVVCYVILPGTPPRVKFDIFRRINTGGEPLSPQEIRHALNVGICTDLLQTLSQSESFKAATMNGIQQRRMADRECIMRYLAFRDLDVAAYEKNDFNSFLNDAMRKFNEEHVGQSLESAPIRAIAADFNATMDFARELFGNQAFRKSVTGRDVRTPVNKSLFEAWSVNLHRLNEQERKLLQRRKETLLARFRKRLVEDDEFLQSITQGTGSIARVRRRFETVRQIILEVLDDTKP